MSEVQPCPSTSAAICSLVREHAVVCACIRRLLLTAGDVGPDDLPLFAFRLHTWVHCLGECTWTKTLLGNVHKVQGPLYVRIIVKEPRFDDVSVDTGSVCAQEPQIGKASAKEAGVADQALRRRYVWEQHVTLDFNGHEDTEILYELCCAAVDGKDKLVIGTARCVCPVSSICVVVLILLQECRVKAQVCGQGAEGDPRVVASGQGAKSLWHEGAKSLRHEAAKSLRHASCPLRPRRLMYNLCAHLERCVCAGHVQATAGRSLSRTPCYPHPRGAPGGRHASFAQDA